MGKTPWNNAQYLNLLKNHDIWDYSKRNIRFLTDYGIEEITHVPLGYCPQLTRLDPCFHKDIDVLFYGALNERREAILNELTTKARVVRLTNAYGKKRDLAIARAHLVLNMHYYSPATLETPRLSYLLDNKKAIVAERNPSTEFPEYMEGTCRFAPYEQLAETTLELLRNQEERKRLEMEGAKLFAAYSQTKFLEKIVGRRIYGPPKQQKTHGMPTAINIGSGKNFQPTMLNIDINNAFAPDIVLDISKPLNPTSMYDIPRFGGALRLKPGSFQKIILFDVLEHVENAIQTMTNLLDLLAIGGQCHINVPYDLSYGAWQDPTHVRAFNENSWLYYTAWAWYIGWQYNRFALEKIEFIYSPHGHVLLTQGVDEEIVRRTPRAVDSMFVVLTKVQCTAEDLEQFHIHNHSAYQQNAVVHTLEDLQKN